MVKKKVIWVFTSSKKIMVASSGEKWVITDWSESVSVIENITINLEKMVKENV